MATTLPPGPGGTFDFGKPFQFVFQDPDWIKKVLLGGLFTFLCFLMVGIPFVVGYEMRLLKRAAQGHPRPLPEWEDYGGLFMDGLRGWGLSLAYFVAVLFVPGGLACVLGVVGSGFSEMSGSDTAEGLAAIGVAGLYLLCLLLGLILGLYVPAALIRLVLFDRFGAGFEVREVLDFIKRNLGNYALALLVTLLAGMLAGFGWILCCIGFLPAAFWARCVKAFSMGEVARLDRLMAGSPGTPPDSYVGGAVA